MGVARVSEALQAHMWPLMTLKSRPAAASGSEANCSHSEDRSQSSTTGNGVDQRTREPSQSTSEGTATGSSVGDTSQGSGRDSTARALEHGSSGGKSNGGESSQARLDSLLGASDLQLLENGLDESGDGSEGDFESLFAKFAQMKGIYVKRGCMSIDYWWCCKGFQYCYVHLQNMLKACRVQRERLMLRRCTHS